MILCGIDPGTIRMGYCILELERPQGLNLHAMGVIDAGDKKPLGERLLLAHNHLADLFLKFRPEEIILEETFVGKNPRTAITLGEARGIVRICAQRINAVVIVATAAAARKGVMAKGDASKQEIQRIIWRILDTKERPPLDASDAAALAIARAWGMGSREEVLADFEARKLPW